MSSEEAVKAWNLIRLSLALSFPPGIPPTEATLVNMQRALIEGRLTAWALILEGKIYAIATTTITEDTMAGIRTFYIYSLSSFYNIPTRAWKIGIESFYEEARKRGCYSIVARTNNKRLIKLVGKMGTRTDIAHLNMEVPR